MTALRTNTVQHTNGTTSFTIGTNGKVTWNTNSGSYVRVTPSSNIWQGTVSAQFDATFKVNTLFSQVPLTAKAVHTTATAFNSGRNDHAVHLIGGDVVYTGTTSWFNGPVVRERRTGSFQINIEGESSAPCSHFGQSECGIILVNSFGDIPLRLADGYSSGTHYVVLTAWGYWY
jgi:hypothetical protein